MNIRSSKCAGLLLGIFLVGILLLTGCLSQITGYCNNIHEGEVVCYHHVGTVAQGDDYVTFKDGCCYQILLIEVLDCNGVRVANICQCEAKTYKLVSKNSDYAMLVPSNYEGDICHQDCCSKCQNSCEKCRETKCQ
jgi:hypothetical protein